MSYGFARQQSPAARRARQVKNLTVEEISTVDHGAGRGVSVVLMKSDSNEETGIMKLGDINLHGACAQAVTLAKRGEISASTFDAIFKMAAQRTFPQERTIGQAMQRFMDTPIGAEMLRTGVSLPTPYQAALMKTA